jgi:4-diphosphocytidyl-2-C-methyl-D-erythritol kinase
MPFCNLSEFAGFDAQIRAPAKINLYLSVCGKRPDGYHDICTLFARVALFDVLTLTFAGREIAVTTNDRSIPADDSNLAVKAVRLFRNLTGIEAGIRIHIEKNIPAAAGLGGGSADAAAVLWALNRRFGTPVPPAELMVESVRLGADVPFFLFPHAAAVGTGIGDRLTPAPAPPACPVVIVNPGFSVSTKWVYENLNLGLTSGEKPYNLVLLIPRLLGNRTSLLNDLESVTGAHYPVVGKIRRRLSAAGAVNTLMSGSGPSVFGLFPDENTAGKAADSIRRDDPEAKAQKVLQTALLANIP